MSRGKMILTYIVLAILVILSSIPFGLELRPLAQGAQSVSEAEDDVLPPTPPPVATPTPQKWRQTTEVARVFGRTQVFRPVVTPKPTPTRTPLPTPTMTPKPLANGYTVELCASTMAIIVSYTLNKIPVRVGQVVPEPLGDFKILEVDPKLTRVKVQLVEDPSRIGWIEEQKQTAPRTQ